MKPKNITAFLFMVSILFSTITVKAAMRANISPSNKSGVFQTYTGNGPVSTKYLVTAVYPDNVQLQVVPAQPCTINAHIVNANGSEVLAIGSANVDYRFVKSVSIATLPAGSYYIEFVSGTANDKKYRIPFSVSQ
jgi:hypothetical protein